MLVGAFGPDEGPGLCVVEGEKLTNGLLKLLGGAEAASPKLRVGERGEPAFHHIEPARRGGSEMQVEAGAFHQPALNGRRFASRAANNEVVPWRL